MNTDVFSETATLEELIRIGQEILDSRQQEFERSEQERQLAMQKAHDVQLELVLEQLPAAVHPYVELRGPDDGYGRIQVEILPPAGDRIMSTWRFDTQRGAASLSNNHSAYNYEVQTFVADHYHGFPRSIGEHHFESLAEALAFAVEQGPTYEQAEAEIAEQAKQNQAKAEKPTCTLKDRLQITLENLDELGLGSDPHWRLTAVVAEALVSIAESQNFLSISREI